MLKNHFKALLSVILNCTTTNLALYSPVIEKLLTLTPLVCYDILSNEIIVVVDIFGGLVRKVIDLERCVRMPFRGRNQSVAPISYTLASSIPLIEKADKKPKLL